MGKKYIEKKKKEKKGKKGKKNGFVDCWRLEKNLSPYPNFFCCTHHTPPPTYRLYILLYTPYIFMYYRCFPTVVVFLCRKHTSDAQTAYIRQRLCMVQVFANHHNIVHRQYCTTQYFNSMLDAGLKTLLVEYNLFVS